MKARRVSLSLMLGLGLMLALSGFFTLIGRAAPGDPTLDPAPNTHTAPSTTTVSITYDEAIDAATVTSRTFAVHGMQGGLVTATHSVSGSAISIDPVRPFHPGELVQVSATTGTLNLGGEGPISPTVWQFRTAVQGGTGRFGSVAHDTFGAGDSRDLALGDLDGDGDLDAVVANYSGQAQEVWFNAGDGTYPISSTFGSGDSWDVALGDVDGDGDLDAVVANRNAQVQEAWLNDGSGSFPISTTFGSSDSRAIALGDLDGDGDLDAVTANDDEPQAVFLNDGGGTFTAHTTFGSGDSQDLALGDLDGDGDLDAVVANGSNQAQNVCFNDGHGAFLTCADFGGGRMQAVALGDVDADGDLDAVLAGNSGDPQEVWLNDGFGGFPISTTFGAGTSRGLALGDVDGDGDLDAVVANYGEPQEVWLNSGSGTYTTSRTFDGGNSWYAALGDVDGDGDLDSVVANGNAAQEVWLNVDSAVEGRIYVDTDAVGANDGSSWADAFAHLQDALLTATSGDEIWVAEGVYYPDEGIGQTDDDRTSTFQLVSGAALYGGFVGTETQRSERDWTAHVTVLSGDLDQDDQTDTSGVVTHTAYITNSNAYHVVTGSGVDATAILDGFTITAGKANGGGQYEERGGGMYTYWGSPTLAHATFMGNYAKNWGGGMYGNRGHITMTHMVFAANHANGYPGGGMYNFYSDPVISNTVFVSNTARLGGGMANRGGNVRLSVVTFTANAALDGSGGGIYNDESDPYLEHVTFISNTTSSSGLAVGGGMYNAGSSPVLVHTSFISNSAQLGGGMCSMYSGSPVLTDVTFLGNTAYDSGGGMYNSAISPSLTLVTFTLNTAFDSGGGMYTKGDGNVTMNQVLFLDNTAEGDGGGGLYNRGVTLTMNRVSFIGNRATGTWGRGGGMRNFYESDPLIVNTLFSGNHANYQGGGMDNYAVCNPKLVNVTFGSNSAGDRGGGLSNSSTATLTNTILWGNTSGTDAQIYSSGALTITHSLVQDSGGSGPGWDTGLGFDGGGNLDIDPQFVDLDGTDNITGTLDDDLRLQFGSPAVDVGDNASVAGTTDLDGHGRLRDGDGDGVATVDMGAYEYQRIYIYVNADATGADDGSSWADAYVHLQDALDEANGYGGATTCEIWVAEGVYTPDEDGDGDHTNDDRTESFQLHYDGIQLYGGFAGTESDLGARDPELHVTVLSGDIDQNDTTDIHGVVTTTDHISGANAYHVLWLDGVSNGPITSDTIIDGFAITAGWADGESDYYKGGGLHCSGRDGGVCSPVLSGVIFSGNMGLLGGGMYSDGYNGTSSLVLTDVTFSNNGAIYDGGGMYSDGRYGPSSPTLTSVTFSGNWAGSVGGGMYNYGRGNTGSPVLTGVIFSGNTAGIAGGGMYNDGEFGTSSPVLTNVIFSGNQADNAGGGMYNDGEDGISSPVLINVTFSGNRAADGGGMYNDGSSGTSSPVLTNVILWGNQAFDGAQMYNRSASPTVSYSLVQGGCPSGATCDHLLTTDPQFVRDPDPGPDAIWGTADDDYGDLRLQSGSPAIDAGDNAAVPPGITTDLAGNPRIIGGTVDMGAYEASGRVYLPLVMR